MGEVYKARDTRLDRTVTIKSDETGTSEIYVSSFPEPGETYRVVT